MTVGALASNGSGTASAWAISLTAPVRAITTEQVLNATAGALAGGVGTYSFATPSSDIGVLLMDQFVSGSLLWPISAAASLPSGSGFSFSNPTALSGTWRSMAVSDARDGAALGASLWLRVA
jgi:hypothetical protein